MLTELVDCHSLPGGSASRPIKVAIIEDQKHVREGMVALIHGTRGYRCIGAFHSMEAALAESWSEIPDLVLLDIGLPGISGIEGLALLRERYTNAALVMLTVYEDDERIFDALCNGADGYLLKNTPPAKLLENIGEAARGGSPISPEIAARVIRLFRSIRPPKRSDHNLTPHELRILKLLVEGHNYKSAAAELGVSFNTVHFHMQRIYEKLHVHSKSAAVSKALRNRFIT